jgi:glycosyltransferase involved in cell wall biosynthesis
LEGLGVKKSIAIVIPAYNEEDCIDELAKRLTQVFSVEINYNFEVIIIENGSKDTTWEKLIKISAEDDRFKVVKLSRNFGMDGGLTAGLDLVNADACVFMTADLQDPPETISEFIRLWENGYENIFGIIGKREGTSILRRFNSQIFYWLASKLSSGNIPRNVSDFRLLDRKVYESLRTLKERNRFLRGMTAWVGFKSVGIVIQRPPRFAGESKAFTWKVIDFAFKGIFAYSYKPLRLITISGFVLFTFSILSLIGLTAFWLIRGVPFPGFGSLFALIVLVWGGIALMIGILSEYVGLIYEEVKARPSYIVSEKINIRD